MWCPVGKHGGWVVAAAVVAGPGVAAPAWAVPGAAVAAGSWGKAIEVPGLGALNKGEDAEVNDVACASPSYCAAGGYYTNANGNTNQGFLAVERNGRWGKATQITDLQALNTGGFAEVQDVSCPARGHCIAGGQYTNGPHANDYREFVVSERNGHWGKATQIQSPGGLNAGVDADDMSLACGSVGNCVAGGEYYENRSGNYEGFLAVERNGHWGTATGIPGLVPLNTGGFADVDDVSCGPSGYCAADGYYQDKSGYAEGFLVTGQNGRWGQAIEVPGLAALNTGGTPYNLSASVGAVSCTSAGNCAADGYYTAKHNSQRGFVVSERNGHWGKATQFPSLAALNTGGSAAVGPLDCTSAGNCAAGGYYTPSHQHAQAFVITERNGRWGKATEIRGLASASLNDVSCSSAGNCAAAGTYASKSGTQSFVVTERNGRWGKAIEIPSLGALNTGGDGEVFAVSCGPAGNCAVGGYYKHGSPPFDSDTEGFVVSGSL